MYTFLCITTKYYLADVILKMNKLAYVYGLVHLKPH